MTDGSNIKTVDYLDGFQYAGAVLQFFPTAEGYVKATKINSNYSYGYVYNYTDHLGNVRLSYTLNPTVFWKFWMKLTITRAPALSEAEGG